MTHKAVLLDTSFFIRFLNEADPLFKNSEGYYRYFLQKEIPMLVSTISIAEYCVIGKINELPLKDLQIIPFNLSHAKRTGEFARIAFDNKGKLKLQQRNIIPNDTKLFAQADVEVNIGYYLSSDTESKKIYDLLIKEGKPKFQFIDLNNKYSEVFGVLEF
jgi:predicted nucleic acid-binding protein